MQEVYVKYAGKRWYAEYPVNLQSKKIKKTFHIITHLSTLFF